MKFPCYKCGKCCANVNLSTETTFLDRGDGICKHFDITSKLCTIYKARPDICRVQLQYEQNYSKIYSWKEFILLNLEICKILPDIKIK